MVGFHFNYTKRYQCRPRGSYRLQPWKHLRTWEAFAGRGQKPREASCATFVLVASGLNGQREAQARSVGFRLDTNAQTAGLTARALALLRQMTPTLATYSSMSASWAPRVCARNIFFGIVAEVLCLSLPPASPCVPTCFTRLQPIQLTECIFLPFFER